MSLQAPTLIGITAFNFLNNLRSEADIYETCDTPMSKARFWCRQLMLLGVTVGSVAVASYAIKQLDSRGWSKTAWATTFIVPIALAIGMDTIQNVGTAMDIARKRKLRLPNIKPKRLGNKKKHASNLKKINL